MRDNISIKGARVNNLRNVDLEIPRNKLVGDILFPPHKT